MLSMRRQSVNTQISIHPHISTQTHMHDIHHSREGWVILSPGFLSQEATIAEPHHLNSWGQLLFSSKNPGNLFLHITSPAISFLCFYKSMSLQSNYHLFRHLTSLLLPSRGKILCLHKGRCATWCSSIIYSSLSIPSYFIYSYRFILFVLLLEAFKGQVLQLDF